MVDRWRLERGGVCELASGLRWSQTVFDSLLTTGYIGLFVFIVLTGFGLPLPEELAVVTAGVMAARGQLETVPALVVCMVAALLGDCAVYGLGRFAGRAGGRFRWLLPKVSDERLRSTQALLHRHGFKILLVARFLVGFRFAVYLAVAASRLSFARFVVLDSVCVVAVVGSFFALAHALGARYGDALFETLHTGHLVATAVIVLFAIVAFFVWRWRGSRAAAPSTPPPPTTTTAATSAPR
jgi:membrane protein DedA with SNARE-associated domain